MSAGHHGANSQGPSPEQEALFKRLTEQIEGKARREFPEGRLGGSDDGTLAYAIAADAEKKKVLINFGKPVVWIGLGPQECVDLAEQLIKRAREITTEPLVVSLDI